MVVSPVHLTHHSVFTFPFYRIWEHCPQNVSRPCILHLLWSVWSASVSYLDQWTRKVLWWQSQAPGPVSNQERSFNGKMIWAFFHVWEKHLRLSMVLRNPSPEVMLSFFSFPEKSSIYLHSYFSSLGCAGTFSPSTFCIHVPRGLDIHRRLILLICHLDYNWFWGLGCR